jgi:hypothetical protein
MTSTFDTHHHRTPADDRFSLRISKHCHEQLNAQYGSIAPGVREAMVYLRDNGLEDRSDVDGVDGSDLDGQASKRVTIRVQPQLLAAVDDVVADADRGRSRAIRDAIRARHGTVEPA